MLKTTGKVVKAKAHRAIEVEQRLQEICQSAQREFVEMGLLIKEAEDKSLWAELKDPHTEEPYTSLRHWLKNALPYGLSSAYDARQAVRELDGIPTAALRLIPRCNLKLLLKLPKRARSSVKWIKQATDLAGPALRQKIHLVVPDNAPKVVRINFVLPSRTPVLKALKACAQELGDSTKEEQIETICNAYLLEMSRHKKTA